MHRMVFSRLLEVVLETSFIDKAQVALELRLPLESSLE